MQAAALMQQVVRGAHREWDGVISDLTPEQAHYQPAGVANPIVGLMYHVVSLEDRLINQTIQGKATLWDSGGWAQKLPAFGRLTLDDARKLKVDLAQFKAYAKAVGASTEAYVATLTDAELDRQVQGPRGATPVANFLQVVCNQCLEHGGEISAIKGLQGAKGYA